MFSKIRSLFSSKFGALFALIFIGLIALAFALGDVTGSNTFGGVGAGNAAKIGDQEVTISELRKLTDSRFKSERQRNPNLDIAQFVEAGGLDQTLNQIIDRYVISVFAEKHGLGVSKAMVDAEIRDIPGATGVDGQFTTESFQRLLSRLEISEQSIRTDFIQNLYAQQIFPIASKGSLAPDSLVLPYASLVLERREGQITVIPSSLFTPDKPPSDDTLAAFYKKNATQYIIPERRSVSYALFDSNIVDAQSVASDTDIAAYYKENKSKYSANETRDLEQIIVPTQAAADKILNSVKSGASLNEAAKETSLSVTNRGAVSREDLTSGISKAVSDAVFATKSGDYAKAVRGPLGFYVVKVTNVTATKARSLDDVKNEIASLVSTEKKNTLLAELTTEIEDALEDGATLADIAKEKSLKIETTPNLIATGQDPTNPSYEPIAELPIILQNAFNMENNSKSQLIEIAPGTRFAIITIAKLLEAAPPPLKDIKPGVTQRWALSEGLAKSKIEANKILADMEKGSTLKQAIAKSGLKLPPTQQLKANRFELSQNGQKVPEALALMFAMSAGTTKKIQIPGDQGWILVDLNKIIRGDASKRENILKQSQQQFSNILGQEHISQFINAARQEVGVKKSDDDITALRKTLTSVTVQ